MKIAVLGILKRGNDSAGGDIREDILPVFLEITRFYSPTNDLSRRRAGEGEWISRIRVNQTRQNRLLREAMESC